MAGGDSGVVAASGVEAARAKAAGETSARGEAAHAVSAEAAAVGSAAAAPAAVAAEAGGPPTTFEAQFKAAGRLHADSPRPPGAKFGGKRRAFVMVDGEFTGPHFTRNSVVAWALVVFHEVEYPEHISMGMRGRHAATRARRVYSEIVGSVCVRMRPGEGTVMDPGTFEGFWAKPANAKLAEWVGQGAVSQEKGAATVNSFLREMARWFDLRFISKPAHIDLGRLQHFLDTHQQEAAFRIHHSSVCLLTMRTDLQKLLDAYGKRHLEALVAGARQAAGVSLDTSHFPLDDCRAQILDYITLRNILIHEQQQRENLLRNVASFVATPSFASGAPGGRGGFRPRYPPYS